MYDHAQSPRLGQPTAVENPGIQLVTIETLPEIAYRGQLVYLLDFDVFRVYDGVAWQEPTAAATGGGQTFVQNSSTVGTPVADAVGDLWMDTSDYTLKVWDGAAWQEVQDPTADAAANAASLAQADAQQAIGFATDQITTFYLPTAPGVAENPQEGDQWINTATNTLWRYVGSPLAWVQITDSALAKALNDAGTAQSTADSKIETFITTWALRPTTGGANGIGDLLYVTDQDNKPYRWDGSDWIALPVGTDALVDGAVTRDKIITGAITADLLESSLTLSTVISTRSKDAAGKLTGPGVDMTPKGLFAYDNSGTKIIELPNDPSLPAVFRGDAEIAHLTVETLTTLQETILAQNSVLTMQHSVVEPTNPATPTPYWPNVQMNGADFASYRWGWCEDSTGTYGYTAYRPSSTVSYIEKWDLATGTRLAQSVAHNNTNYSSVSTDGTYVYGVWRAPGSTTSSWKITRWSAGSLGIGSTSTLYPVDTSYGVALGYDAAAGDILFSYNDSFLQKIQIGRCKFAANADVTNVNVYNTNKAFTGTHYANVLYGTFDFPAARYVMTNRGTSPPLVFDTGMVEHPEEGWPKANGAMAVGLAYSTSLAKFRSIDGNGLLSTYEKGTHFWTSSALDNWHLSYSWSNGTAETPMTDPVNFAMTKRAQLLVNTPSMPSNVTWAPIYLTRGSTFPSATAVSSKRQGVSTSSDGLLITQADFSTAYDNVITNGFGTGTPAKIMSYGKDNLGYPLIELGGDGTARIGTINTDTTGKTNVVQQVVNTAQITTTNGLSTNTEVLRLSTSSFEAITNQRYRVYANMTPSNATAGAYTQAWLKWDTSSVGTTGTQIMTGTKDHRIAGRAETFILMGEFIWTGSNRSSIFVKLTMAGQGGAGTDNSASFGATRIWVEAT